MAKRKKKKQDDLLVDIVDVRDQAEDFMEKHQTAIFGVMIALVVLIGGYFVFNKFIQEPKQGEAVVQIAQAQMQFEQDSFALALTNPGGGFKGFIDIIEDYSGTPSANVANYYAGICYLNLGQFDAAISYLKDFNAKGKITPIMKYGALGDAYSEKGDFAKALDYYEKAATTEPNDALTPYYLIKLGMLQEHEGNTDAALKSYQKVKNEYPTSAHSRDIDAHIVRVGG